MLLQKLQRTGEALVKRCTIRVRITWWNQGGNMCAESLIPIPPVTERSVFVAVVVVSLNGFFFCRVGNVDIRRLGRKLNSMCIKEICLYQWR